VRTCSPLGSSIIRENTPRASNQYRKLTASPNSPQTLGFSRRCVRVPLKNPRSVEHEKIAEMLLLLFFQFVVIHRVYCLVASDPFSSRQSTVLSQEMHVYVAVFCSLLKSFFMILHHIHPHSGEKNVHNLKKKKRVEYHGTGSLSLYTVYKMKA
jgi:hypothetical protein